MHLIGGSFHVTHSKNLGVACPTGIVLYVCTACLVIVVEDEEPQARNQTIYKAAGWPSSTQEMMFSKA